MCIVHKPKAKGDKHKLRVINAGDSRVLLGKRDGTIVDGGGTDQGLTTDHKPDDPDESERIYRCGGTVQTEEGNCARVNGDLAVSRGFGDREYKKTGGPHPKDHPVTVDPELKEFECDEADFLMLVCDGVSEGSLTNAQAVELAAKVMRESDSPEGAGHACKAVCHKAVETDSKDNISCMIVLLDGADDWNPPAEFLPGAVDKLGHEGYQKAYSAMATKAGFTLAEAVEKRYELLQASKEELEKMYAPLPGDDEKVKLGTPKGEKGSEERRKWLEKWIADLPEEKDEGPGGMDLNSLMAGKGGGKGGKGGKGPGMAPPGPPAEEEGIEKDEQGYSWSQQGDEVQVTFKLENKATKKDVKVAFKPKTIGVTLAGQSLLEGSLGGEVDVEDCTWTLAGGGSELQVMLTKKNAKDSWKGLLK